METIETYLNNIPEKQREAIKKLREVIKENLPEGFAEVIANGMINYVVPYSIYPPGYHCDPKQPLPFISLANQKNHIALYHMGIYAFKGWHDWFVTEYPKHMTTKLDMGKSCIRFKNPEKIPYQLIAELVTKISVNDWVNCYELQRSKRS